MRGYLEGWFRAYRGGAMQDLGYELPRISILGTSVNNDVLAGIVGARTAWGGVIKA
jgi:hypothetical protein